MNKTNKNFGDYWRSTWAKVEAGQLEEALVLAQEAYNHQFPGVLKPATLLLASTQSMLNQKTAAINTLAKATEQKVFWSPTMLDQICKREFANIKDEEAFKKIYAQCAEWFIALQAKSAPLSITQLPKNINADGSLPLMINLHWRGSGGAEMVAQQWAKILDNDYAMLLPQSSQLMDEQQYCWDDYDLSVKEISTHYQQFTETYQIQENSIILAGASQGGARAVKMLLEDALPTKISRFIVLFPYLKHLEDYEALLPKALENGVKGVFIMGDKDQMFEHIKSFYDTAIAKGLNWKWITMEGVDHTFPPNFDAYLQESMDFLQQD